MTDDDRKTRVRDEAEDGSWTEAGSWPEAEMEEADERQESVDGDEEE
jgi:hypothetical protein